MTGDGEQVEPHPSCCPLYRQAVELIGRRWTGAIVEILMQGGSLRFSEIAAAVPELSDRLLSERMKELEARGVVARSVHSGPPVRVEYRLTEMGVALAPTLSALKTWAQRWLGAASGPDDPSLGAELGRNPALPGPPPVPGESGSPARYAAGVGSS